MTSSSQNNDIDLVINNLFNFFDFPPNMSINMLFENKIPDDLSDSELDEIFVDIVQDKDFISYVNSLKIDSIIYILQLLDTTDTETLYGKFALTIASVLSGQNALKICKYHVFTNIYLMIMIIIRALRQKIFITNFSKMNHPYKFYKFMLTNNDMKNIIKILEQIEKYQLEVYEKHNKKNLKIVPTLKYDIVSLYISQFTYSTNRVKLQKRITMLIQKLTEIYNDYKYYFDKENAKHSSKITEEQFQHFVIKKYGNIDSKISSYYSKSSSLGNRRHDVVHNIKKIYKIYI